MTLCSLKIIQNESKEKNCAVIDPHFMGWTQSNNNNVLKCSVRMQQDSKASRIIERCSVPKKVTHDALPHQPTSPPEYSSIVTPLCPAILRKM